MQPHTFRHFDIWFDWSNFHEEYTHTFSKFWLHFYFLFSLSKSQSPNLVYLILSEATFGEIIQNNWLFFLVWRDSDESPNYAWKSLQETSNSLVAREKEWEENFVISTATIISIKSVLLIQTNPIFGSFCMLYCSSGASDTVRLG